MRYDYLEGEIEHVSPDAIVDQARGLVYPARVRITGSTLRLERLRAVQGMAATSTPAKDDLELVRDMLQAGMSVSAEVKTGKRSVISYILSPIARAINEAGRER